MVKNVLLFMLCCNVLVFVVLVQTVGYQKVLTCILNVFGCHCSPLIIGAWLISSLFIHLLLPVFCLIIVYAVCRVFIYLFVLYIVEPKTLSQSPGL